MYIYRMHLHIQISFKQMIEISMPELLIIAVYCVHYLVAYFKIAKKWS